MKDYKKRILYNCFCDEKTIETVKKLRAEKDVESNFILYDKITGDISSYNNIIALEMNKDAKIQVYQDNFNKTVILYKYYTNNYSYIYYVIKELN